MSERVVVAVAAATAVCAPQAVACAVSAQNEMNSSSSAEDSGHYRPFPGFQQSVKVRTNALLPPHSFPSGSLTRLRLGPRECPEGSVTPSRVFCFTSLWATR
jgi:hypothetical protein